MYVARRARNSVESIANRFCLRETCRGVGRTSVFVFARECACPRTRNRTRTRSSPIYVSRSKTWRNFSTVDTRHRVLREFKIPLTTPRHPDIRYKSHIRVGVRAVHRRTRVHVHLRKRFHSRRFDAELISLPRCSSGIRSINESWQTPYGEAMKYWRRIRWEEEPARWEERRRKGQRLGGLIFMAESRDMRNALPYCLKWHWFLEIDKQDRNTNSRVSFLNHRKAVVYRLSQSLD